MNGIWGWYEDPLVGRFEVFLLEQLGWFLVSLQLDDFRILYSSVV